MSKTDKIYSAIPLLPQTDIQKATAFYDEKLGFEIGFVYENEYAGVMRDDCVLHFWLCQDKKTAENTSCRVPVGDIKPLYEELANSGVIHPNGKLEEKPWGYLEFSVLDEAGNLIVFAEQLPRVDSK